VKKEGKRMKNSALTIRVGANGRTITVLHLSGQLDGTSYQQLIQAAQTAYQHHTQQIILDMAGLHKITLSGFLGLHSVAAILHGEEPLTPEAGWAAIRAMKNDLEDGYHHRLTIANPQPHIYHQLFQAGFTHFVELKEDLTTETAVPTLPNTQQTLEKEQQQPATHVIHHRKQPARYLVKALNLIGIFPKA
jgi:hypothetical protein